VAEQVCAKPREKIVGMKAPKIQMTDSPAEGLRDLILNPLAAFNEVRSGGQVNYRRLAISLSDPDTDEVVGGLWAETYFGMLFVDLLFIPESMRGAGLGRKLLAQAEEEAVRRGCHGVWLDTFSWQARGFYEKLGYSVFGELQDYPVGHQRYFLTKRFG
jgi:GNAT superfamily N-acetyltransferase